MLLRDLEISTFNHSLVCKLLCLLLGSVTPANKSQYLYYLAYLLFC